MVLLKERKIKLRGKVYDIEAFEVWWHVEHFGLFDKIEDALEHGAICTPIPVAVSKDMYEIVQ